MKVVRDPRDLPRSMRTVAIGSFDGVHLGHRRVLDVAFETGMPVAVLTFDPHPRVLLGQPVDLLTTLERKIELLVEYGVEEIVVLKFDHELAQMTPKEFKLRYLDPVGAQIVVAGPDFRFGHDRAGDLELLSEEGLLTRVVEPVAGVSSSTIRDALVEGDVQQAASLLGRPFELDGRVVPGFARGARLGFPTANLAFAPHQLVPRRGIYIGLTEAHRAAVSIGVNPHFEGGELRIEAHLIDFDGDLYGKRLVVELWQRLRDEQAFAGEEELKEQIARDVQAARDAERPAQVS
ncbi:MAG: riboflavin biosynthesis protein RibF [Gaiellaceae bacterium]|jgi:riboflavin kinase/FMN adenylyltransferase